MHKTYFKFNRRTSSRDERKTELLPHCTKTYCKTLNRFLNNVKIPSIPRLLVNEEIVSIFLEKT